MRRMTIPKIILLAIIASVIGFAGCSEEDFNIGDPNLPADKSTTSVDVDAIALWHNQKVDKLVARYSTNHQKGIPNFEDILIEWDHSGEVDIQDIDLPKVRQDWDRQLRLYANGMMDADLRVFMSRSLDEVADERDISSAFFTQLEHCVNLVLDQKSDRIESSVVKLADMARAKGSDREKNIAGVFLGSMQRGIEADIIGPNSPWYRWYLMMDVAGTFSGGRSLGALWSSEVEMFVEDFNGYRNRF